MKSNCNCNFYGFKVVTSYKFRCFSKKYPSYSTKKATSYNYKCN